MNYQCPIAIHCGDYPFANLSSEGIDLAWLPPRGQYWTGIGYCCDTTLKEAWSGISQAEADLAVKRILDTACPTCSDAQKFCADADCDDGSNLTEICVPTSQADADALAAAAALAMAPYCDTKEDLYQATCACPDGTDSHTVHSNISETVAEAQCDAIVKNCTDGGSDDGGGQGGGGGANPGNNPTHGVCNTAQTCTETHEGTVLSYTVPAGTVCKMTLAEANAYALSLACAMLKFQAARLSGLVSFCCLLESLSAPIAITGATGSFTWDIVGTLPPGLTFTQSGNFTGLISGTPTTPGTYTFSVRVLLAANHYATRTYSLVVFGFTTGSVLADGAVGADYSQQIVADGGSGNYFFEVTAGTLPDGLALGDTGFITGTPTTEETALFTVTVQDLVMPLMTCSLQFQIDILSGKTTQVIVSAWHQVSGVDDLFTLNAAVVATPVGTTDPIVIGQLILRWNSVPQFLAVWTTQWDGITYPSLAGGWYAATVAGGALMPYNDWKDRIVDVTYTNADGLTPGYPDSVSESYDLSLAGNWNNNPAVLTLDVAATAAINAIYPFTGTLTQPLGTGLWADSLFGTIPQTICWAGLLVQVIWNAGANRALFMRHENAYSPLGTYYYFAGTHIVDQITIT